MKLVYINPQSYNNLSKYDAGYLSELGEWNRHYICSTLLDRDIQCDISTYKLFRYNRKFSVLARVFSYSWSLVRSLFLIRRISPDVVHVQWVKVPVVDYMFLKLARLLTKCKIVMTAHNVAPHNQTDRRHFWLGRIYALVDVVLVHEVATASAIREKFMVADTTIRVVRHGTIALENSGQTRFESEIAAFFEPAKLKMCFFGRGSHYKGIDILLEAWKQLSNDGSNDAYLLVIGRLDDDIRRLVSNSVPTPPNILIIDEFVSEADLYVAVTQSDVVLFPYRNISQSGALLSVLNLGKPIVVSDHNGLTEPLKFGDIGWVFDGTAEKLSELISALLNDPAVVYDKRDNRQAWSTISAYYSWSAVGDDIRAAYD